MAELVMVVEDEANIGALVCTYLERAGYRTLWVRSGEQALAELPRHPVALVVLDLRLPGIDGLEVCRALDRSLPLIVVSARDEEADRVAGLELGADDYVTKPFSPAAREVHLDGREIELTQREFDLLEYLLRHAGRVVTREQLLESVWGYLAPGETRTIEVHVAQLRKKLGRPELIRTVRGVGYKAVA